MLCFSACRHFAVVIFVSGGADLITSSDVEGGAAPSWVVHPERADESPSKRPSDAVAPRFNRRHTGSRAAGARG